MTKQSNHTDACQFRFVDSAGATTTSTRFAQHLLADSIQSISAELAEAIRAEQNWRQNYQRYFLAAAKFEFADRNQGFDFASAALSIMGARIQAADGNSLGELANSGFRKPGLVHTLSIKGQGQAQSYWPDKPHPLISQARNWNDRGYAEADVVNAFEYLQNNPSLPIASDLLIALAGNAELAATKDWLSLGGRVAVIARQNEATWLDLIQHARGSAGELLIPVAAETQLSHSASDKDLAGAAGIDFVNQIEASASWIHELSRIENRVVLASFAYVGGSKQIIAQAAQDALIAVASENIAKSKLALSYLATPLDVVVADSALAEKQFAAYAIRTTPEKIRDVIFSRFGSLKPASPTVHQGSKDSFTIFDASSVRQGPSYLLAKHSEKWRALVSARRGNLVSFTVAPPATTRSVLSVKILNKTYRGLKNFAVEPFDAKVTRRAMALILLRNLHDPASPAAPQNSLGNPVAMVSATAIHGGIWRLGYHPDSIWVAATLFGWLSN